MEARRQKNTAFLVHCLSLMGVKNPSVQWPKMAPGTDLDEATLLSMAWGTGLYHENEIRPRLAEIAHITVVNDKAPAGVMYPNNANSLNRKDIDADSVSSDGSNEMTNGQGKDNLGLGNISHRSARTAPTVDTTPNAS